MQTDLDRELGESAVRSKLISREELDGCIQAQKLRPRALKEVLHEMQLVTLLQVDALEKQLKGEKAPPPKVEAPASKSEPPKPEPLKPEPPKTARAEFN